MTGLPGVLLLLSAITWLSTPLLPSLAGAALVLTVLCAVTGFAQWRRT